MDDPENTSLEDDEEELPPPHQSHKKVIVLGAVVLILLIALGSFAALRTITKASIAPTPTAVNYGPPVPPPWVEPSYVCDQAVQKIEQNQIAYLIVYREKDGGPAIPKNAVTGIEVLPRGVSYQGDPAQSDSLISIYTTYPDHACLPQMLAAVKQTNKTLPKSQQIKIEYTYPYGE
jgi:hypothetical protein